MGTVFAPTYASVTMGNHEIKVYSIIHQSYTLVSKCFENSCFRFLDDFTILLKVNQIKLDDLLSVLNQINNIQFTTENSQTKLPFLDITINKSGTNLHGYLQQTNRLKTICPIHAKPPTTLFNKYTILFCKGNMYHCRK